MKKNQVSIQGTFQPEMFPAPLERYVYQIEISNLDTNSIHDANALKVLALALMSTNKGEMRVLHFSGNSNTAHAIILIYSRNAGNFTDKFMSVFNYIMNAWQYKETKKSSTIRGNMYIGDERALSELATNKLLDLILSIPNLKEVSMKQGAITIKCLLISSRTHKEQLIEQKVIAFLNKAGATITTESCYI